MVAGVQACILLTQTATAMFDRIIPHIASNVHGDPVKSKNLNIELTVRLENS